MPLANAWKLCVCLVVVVAGLIRPAVGQVPPLQNPYDPAYLAAPALESELTGVPGIVLPLPDRFRDGKALLTFEDFFSVTRDNPNPIQRFNDTHWYSGTRYNPKSDSGPYKIVYEHPYFIMYVTISRVQDSGYHTHGFIMFLFQESAHEPPRYYVRSTFIGDRNIFDFPTSDILDIMQQRGFFPILTDDYINLNVTARYDYELFHRDFGVAWIISVPLRCRTENPPECRNAREDCDRYPDLCGYVEEVQQKLGFTFDDPKSILPQTQRPSAQ